VHTYTHTQTQSKVPKFYVQNLVHYFTPQAFFCHLHKLSTQSMTIVFSFPPTQKQTVHKTSARYGTRRQWVAKKTTTTTTTTIFRQQVYLHHNNNIFTITSLQASHVKKKYKGKKKKPMKLLPTSHLAHSSHVIFNIPNKIKHTKNSWLNNKSRINLLAYISVSKN
jgi:hypothetical protein